MKPDRIILILGIAVFILAGVSLGWGYWPSNVANHTVEFPPDRLPRLGKPAAGYQGTYIMELAYAPVIRTGDPTQVRVIFRLSEMPDRSENQPVMENIFVETRLELPGVQVEPSGTAGQVFNPGRTVTFWWEVEANRAGTFEGTAWLGLRVKSPANSPDQFVALGAPRVEIMAARLWFLSGPAARWTGAFGIALGTILFLWRRRHA